MRRNSEQVHAEYLEELIHHLPEMGEDMREARWIMKDGIYLKEGVYSQNKLCDIILGYDNHAVVAELKGSRKKRNYAVKQMVSGERLVNSLGMNVPHGLFVVYSSGYYHAEKMNIHTKEPLEKYVVRTR